MWCNKVIIKNFDDFKASFVGEPVVTWIDVRTEGGFTREFYGKKYFYNKTNDLVNIEHSFNFIGFPKEKKDTKLNDKIGSIDFETFGSNLGKGHQQVYAAGFAIKDHTELSYIQSSETSEQFINRFFLSILMNHNLNGYTIYAHNLGRFYSVFILKSLILNPKLSLKPIWKDNAILSLTVKCDNVKFTLLDSINLIPGKLKTILNSYNCNIKKGNFPYKFVNKENLFYTGEKPSKDFYSGISDKEYLSIPQNNWNLQTETLNYLRSDVEGLLEVLNKFSETIFNKYQLNITRFKSLSGLVLAAYRTSYLSDNLRSEIKIIKSDLESEIRSAYFGGSVEVYINEI